MAQQLSSSALALVAAHIHRTTDDDRFVVVMTCGIAGSGKTTLAKAILQNFPAFTRLSVDEIVGRTHGLYGINYPADEDLYERYLEEADAALNEDFENLLQKKQDIVLDRSLYDKNDRTYYRKLVEDAGGRTVLVYFDPQDKELLWTRIQTRAEGEVSPNSAFKISRDMFEKYWEGFDIPYEEDRLVVRVMGDGVEESVDVANRDLVQDNTIIPKAVS